MNEKEPNQVDRASRRRGPCCPCDLAPGYLDESTDPPTWHAEGDGEITIADVVVLLRVAVKLQQLEETTAGGTSVYATSTIRGSYAVDYPSVFFNRSLAGDS